MLYYHPHRRKRLSQVKRIGFLFMGRARRKTQRELTHTHSGGAALLNKKLEICLPSWGQSEVFFSLEGRGRAVGRRGGLTGGAAGGARGQAARRDQGPRPLTKQRDATKRGKGISGYVKSAAAKQHDPLQQPTDMLEGAPFIPAQVWGLRALVGVGGHIFAVEFEYR